MEARRTTGSEHDVVVRTPGRAPAVGRRLANRMGRPSGQLDLSQLAVGEETDPPPIGREERIVGALAAGNRAGIETIELSDVEPCRSVLESSNDQKRPSGEMARGREYPVCREPTFSSITEPPEVCTGDARTWPPRSAAPTAIARELRPFFPPRRGFSCPRRSSRLVKPIPLPR